MIDRRAVVKIPYEVFCRRRFGYDCEAAGGYICNTSRLVRLASRTWRIIFKV